MSAGGLWTVTPVPEAEAGVTPPAPGDPFVLVFREPILPEHLARLGLIDEWGEAEPTGWTP